MVQCFELTFITLCLWMAVLVVEERQETGELEVLFLVSVVSKVAGWSYFILDHSRIWIHEWKVRNGLLDVTALVIFWMVATLLKVKTIVRSTNCHKIPYRKLRVAPLNDIPPDQRSLTNAQDAKLLAIEYSMLLYLLASFVSL